MVVIEGLWREMEKGVRPRERAMQREGVWMIKHTVVLLAWEMEDAKYDNSGWLA